ncbi:ParA family protein [Rhodomicrobium sp. Az07]|uniref:ParA family protein n=1 Tax=Rhodomicrobium sp. Az07 TaxID=2839034 RepID=UPI001BE5D156|nr:ParA family protein [Rhodomicrobium sp. Az07]MBT3071441.1 ParA family protein [Rhodomicrobium sp. Az07]
MEQLQERASVIVFGSPKGGVGKSTLCLALAGAIVRGGGKVLILDLDNNKTLADWYEKYPDAVPGLTVKALASDQLTDTLESQVDAGYDSILIDVAGSAERALYIAATAADLIITPARISGPDLVQATRLLRDIRAVTRGQIKKIPHLILLNDVHPLHPAYQTAAVEQIDAAGLPRFRTLLYNRAAYREAFLTGKPPHFADDTRAPVKKTIEEIDALLGEVLDIINPEEAVHELAA